MDWTNILEGALSSSPVAAVLGYVSWKLWGKVEQKDIAIDRVAREKDAEIREKDVEIARLNESRLQELRQIARLED